MQECWHACTEGIVLPGQSLVVGLSGGIDSLSLLHWLVNRRDACRNPLTALHVHHGLSADADAWANACQAICASMAVPLSVVEVEVERGSKDGLEGAARRVRHAAYAQAEGDWVILAHHRGDQAETLLFNLLRGCGVRGAGAMRRRHGRLLRPWLDIGRDVIKDYARQAGLTWVEDKSNTDVRYSRNFLRHCVFPRMGERFPAAEARFSAAARRFDEAQDLLDELARIDLGHSNSGFPVPVTTLASLSDARARNLLAYLLRANGVHVANERRLSEALRQLLTAAPDRHPAVTFDKVQLVRCKGMISLVR